MRIALQCVLRQPDLREQVPDLLILLLAAPHVLDDERLAQQRLHAHPRIERRIGVLEDHLQVAPRTAQRSASHAEHLAALQGDPPRVRFLDADDQLAERGLAAARFSDQSQCLADVDVQVHPGHGLDRVDLALEDRAGRDRVLAHRVDDLQKVAVARLTAFGGGPPANRDLRRRRRRTVHWVPAREQVIGTGAVQRRLLRSTLVGGVRTARSKAAAGGRARQVGRDPGDAHQGSAIVLAQLGDRSQQRLRVGMPHGSEDLFGRGRLDDSSRIHDADPVGPAGHDSHVVGDQQSRHAQAILQIVEQGQDLGLDRDVQGRRRLVGEQHLRLAGQRDGDHHPLTHPAGQLVRVVAQPVPGMGQADQLEHLQRAGVGLGSGPSAVQPHGLGHLLADRLCRVQRRLRVLEDHRHLVAPELAHPLVRQAHQVLAIEPDRPLDDLPALGQQPHDRQPQHRLAAAGLPHQTERLAGVDRQVDVPHGLDGRARQLDVCAEVADLEHARLGSVVARRLSAGSLVGGGH